MFIFTTILNWYFSHVVTQDFAGAVLSKIPIVVVPSIECAPVPVLDELVAEVKAIEERPAEHVASLPQVPIDADEEEDVVQESEVDIVPSSSAPVASNDVLPIASEQDVSSITTSESSSSQIVATSVVEEEEVAGEVRSDSEQE